ncbi:MAG: RnfH family protein [Rhodoferax sp.]|nr:RnfH family protein [Rhodoferax sp.]
MATPSKSQVSVLLSTGPRRIQEVALDWAAGLTAAQAVRVSGLLEPLSQAEVDLLTLGVWGLKVLGSQPLIPGDRVELYRPLKVDPKVARRERFVKQGAKAAGLFAKRRAGAKAGY